MTMNPYKPPKSTVGDHQPARLLASRPKEVIQAVQLLWLSIIIAIPLLYFEQQRSTDDAAYFLSVFTVIIFALVAGISIYVWRGANWARIVVLIIAVLSVATTVATINEFLGYSLFEICLEMVSLVIDVLASYLLFTNPGALWFRRAPQG